MKESIVLNLSHTSDVQICVVCDNYLTCITASDNHNFISPAVSVPVATNIAAQVAATKKVLNQLREAIAAPKSLTRTDSIRVARTSLDGNVTMLANLIENVANAPTVQDMKRAAIIHSAGMAVKLKTNRKKPKFKALQSGQPGAIYVTVGKRANAHLWEYTTDLVGFTNRVMAEPTTTVTTEITGLDIGAKYAVFHKPVTPHGPNPWEGPVFITVT